MDKYQELISQIGLTYTEAEKAGIQVKVSVYGIHKQDIKEIAEKLGGDCVTTKKLTHSVVNAPFGEFLLFDKKIDRYE